MEPASPIGKYHLQGMNRRRSSPAAVIAAALSRLVSWGMEPARLVGRDLDLELVCHENFQKYRSMVSILSSPGHGVLHGSPS
jgi:hypothetical protein